MNKDSIIAIIPAYNEEKNIGSVLSVLTDLKFDIVVVNDHSTDRTAQVAEQFGTTVLNHIVNLGYSGALETGYAYAIKKGYQIVLQIDGDGQHEPLDALKVLAPILSGEADIVIGSRYLENNGYKTTWPKRMGQRIFGKIAQLLCRIIISDPTSGYQAMRIEVPKAYLSGVFPEEYPDADLFILLKRMNFRIREVPVRMYPNSHSSIHWGVIRPLYYIYKMSLALGLSMIQKLPDRKEP
jgi:hypothetical protein